MKGTEELVPLIGMGAKQSPLALVQLDLGHLNGSSHAPLLCDQGSNFSMHVMVPLELSCDSPVFLGSGVVVHGGVHGVVGEAFEEPVGELPFFIDGDALGGKELMSVDRLIDANGAQTVQPVQFDIGGKDMHGVITVSNWDEEVEDVAFVFLITLWSLSLPFPGSIPPVGVFLPVLVGCFQVSCMCLMFGQLVSLLLECLELPLIVMADFLIFLRSSCQSLCDEKELFSTWQPVSLESSTH